MSTPALRYARPIVFLFILATIFPSAAFASVPDIGQMFANFSSTSVSLMNLTVGFAFLLGLVITAASALKFKEYSESGGRTALKTPIGFFLVGVCLVALPGSINTATETLSLGSNSGLSVFSTGGTGGIPGMDAAIKGILLFVKLVGHIAFVRGFLILKKLSEGAQGAEMGRALTHIFGGAAAININATIGILASIFGIPLPV